MTLIHKDSVRRWNLWFPSAGVFAEVLEGRATGWQITLPNQGVIEEKFLDSMLTIMCSKL